MTTKTRDRAAIRRAVAGALYDHLETPEARALHLMKAALRQPATPDAVSALNASRKGVVA